MVTTSNQDITNNRYTKLVTIGCTKTKSKNGDYLWNCLCDCGNFCIVSVGNLNSGHTKSCGCIKGDLRRKREDYHGMTGTKEYKSWLHMRERCTKEDHPNYDLYGGRGIKVFDGWLKDFKSFYSYIGPMPIDGKRYTIDRVDNDRGYLPGNVRWATNEQQSRNRNKPKSNTSGVLGVGWEDKLHPDKKNSTTYTVAQWKELCGKPRKKCFSVKRYGHELAFLIACEYRIQQIELLNLQGAGYPAKYTTYILGEK